MINDTCTSPSIDGTPLDLARWRAAGTKWGRAIDLKRLDALSELGVDDFTAGLLLPMTPSKEQLCEMVGFDPALFDKIGRPLVDATVEFSFASLLEIEARRGEEQPGDTGQRGEEARKLIDLDPTPWRRVGYSWALGRTFEQLASLRLDFDDAGGLQSRHIAAVLRGEWLSQAQITAIGLDLDEPARDRAWIAFVGGVVQAWKARAPEMTPETQSSMQHGTRPA